MEACKCVIGFASLSPIPTKRLIDGYPKQLGGFQAIEALDNYLPSQSLHQTLTVEPFDQNSNVYFFFNDPCNMTTAKQPAIDNLVDPPIAFVQLSVNEDKTEGIYIRVKIAQRLWKVTPFMLSKSSGTLPRQ